MDLVVTRKEAAAMLRVCERTLIGMEKAGVIKPIRISKGKVVYPVDYLKEFVKSRQEQG